MTSIAETIELRFSGEAPLACRLRRSRRRTLAIHVLEDGAVEVRAPLDCPRPAIEAFLDKRRGWIERHRARRREAAAQRPDPPAHGSRHPYLGGWVTLAVSAGAGRAALRGELLHLPVKRPQEPAAAARALDAWYRARARELFPARMDHWREQLSHWRLPPARLRIRAMRTRWGTCSTRGWITLNLALIQRPVALLDYVVVHELTHLRVFDHGPRFRALMDEAMPDWRQRRAALRG